MNTCILVTRIPKTISNRCDIRLIIHKLVLVALRIVVEEPAVLVGKVVERHSGNHVGGVAVFA